MTVDLRPLRTTDAAAAATLSWTEIARVMAAPGSEPDERTPDDVERSEARVRHLIDTDPAGCWAAWLDDELVGCGLSLRRGGLWFLSLLAVRHDLQAAGTGKRLMAATETAADGAAGGLITSSPDPRALRRYSLAGFDLRPSLVLTGTPVVDGAVRGVRDGDWDRDADLVEQVVSRLRGSGYGPDLAMFARNPLLVVDGPRRGYAVHTSTTVVALGADDPATAGDLLTEGLRRIAAEPPPAGKGAPETTVRWVTADQQWAVTAALAAGLRPRPGSAVCTRGEVGPLAPYLVNGAYG